MKLNVYLDPTERKQLEQIKQKYQVSLSTIAEKTAFYLVKYYAMQNDCKIETIFKTRIGTSKNKTSIKPKNNAIIDAQLNKLKTPARTLYTNALRIYINKNLLNSNIKDPKLKQNYYMEIDRDLQKTNEPNWNYNNLKRSFIRLQKEQDNEK